MGYLNRWSMSCLWVAAMILAWFNVVPSLLSPSTWLIGALAGPVLIVGTATFWETARPTPSFRQSQATGEAAKVATGQRRLLLARLQKECDRQVPYSETKQLLREPAGAIGRLEADLATVRVELDAEGVAHQAR